VGDLLRSTALLSLETARKVRLLNSVATRTVFIPDHSPVASTVRIIAARDRTYRDTEHVYTWAELVLAVLEHANEGMPAATRDLLRSHANACSTVDVLIEDVLHCILTRCHAGNGCNLVLAVSPSLQQIAYVLLRALICAGCSIRFGPAPRGGKERAVAAALNTL
jgi:hypothetical protein